MQQGTIDWSAAWLAPWRTVGEAVAAQLHAGLPLHEALNAVRGDTEAIPHFVAPDALAPGESYERYIFNSKQCPVHDGYHDFFNGICWLQFPQTKSRLNALHAQALQATQGSDATQDPKAARGPVRDALTVFDENAAFLMAPPEVADQLWPALLSRNWWRLFVDLRPLWQQVQPLLFGHALLEKLLAPRKPITAHVFIASCAITSIAQLDAHIASQLHAETLARKPFAPLPVLGIPGWHAENENPAFYNDPKVFRVAP